MFCYLDTERRVQKCYRIEVPFFVRRSKGRDANSLKLSKVVELTSFLAKGEEGREGKGQGEKKKEEREREEKWRMGATKPRWPYLYKSLLKEGTFSLSLSSSSCFLTRY